MTENLEQDRFHWTWGLILTIGLIILHFIIFFPYHDGATDSLGYLWAMLQGPLGMFTYRVEPIGMNLIPALFYCGEVSGLILWQVYYKRPFLSWMMFGLFLFIRFSFVILLLLSMSVVD
ncbi:MAG: hypothetical protein Q4A17_14965 [Thermoguttaceae bacterium]|nr:hypothetical protein [Thermoguttaceae bacterium]